jgi:hypothetical protein
MVAFSYLLGVLPGSNNESCIMNTRCRHINDMQITCASIMHVIRNNLFSKSSN